MSKTINITFTEAGLNLVLKSLAEKPYSQVYLLIEDLQRQINQQLAPEPSKPKDAEKHSEG